MKKFLLLILFSNHLYAGDLIYLNGFEDSRLVSGSAIGITSTGLQLTLTSSGASETLNIDADDNIIFSLPIPIGNSWNVEILALPNNPDQQNCTLSNSSGIMPPLGVNNILITCNSKQWKWNEMNWNEGGWQ